MPEKEMVNNYNVYVKLCGDNAPQIKNLQERIWNKKQRICQMLH